MIEREIAWRVFAHEFNNSDYFFHEGDERAPNYLITPTGAKVNRLYFVGVLTEIDNIGVGEDMWRGRISDPTGAFMVYAGQYQPEAAVFLSGLDVPSFLAVVGKARAYEPEKGTIYTSVRPEELNTVDGALRDRWIVDTARLTLERINWMRTALGSGMRGEGLISMLVQSGAGAELAKNICKAIEHYPDLDKYLENLSTAVLNALRTVVPSNEPAVTYPLGETSQDHSKMDATAMNEETKIVRETPAEFEMVVDGPGTAHLNTMDTPEPVHKDDVDTPEPVHKDVVDTPESVHKDIVDTPEPVHKDIVDTPEPVHKDIVDTPESVHKDVVDTPESVHKDVVDTPEPVHKDIVDTPEPVHKNTMDTPEPTHKKNIDTSEPDGPNADEIIYELMGRLDTGKGVYIAELIEESKQWGLWEEQVDEAVKALMSEGKCYEPRIGVLRRV